MMPLLVIAAAAQALDFVTFAVLVGPDREGWVLAGQPIATVLFVKSAAVACVLALAYLRRYRVVFAAVIAWGIAGAISNFGALA